jgi:hypothetical protein
LQPKTKFEIRRTEAEKIQQVQNTIKEQLMVQDQGVLCSNSDVKEYNMYGDEDLFYMKLSQVIISKFRYSRK